MSTDTIGQPLPGSCTEVGMCAHCGEVASQRCGNCRQVFYCGKKCQKTDWKSSHKEDCRPVRIGEDGTVGRYLVATRHIKAGDIIFKEDPLVVGPSQITEPICLSCYKRVYGSYRCSKCSWPLCGPECEEVSDHQPECVVGQEMGSPIDIGNFSETNHFYEVVTPLRCLTLKKRSPRKYEQLMNLESHYEDRKGTHIYEENHKRIVNMLRNYFMLLDYSPDILDSSEYTIHKISGILDVNAVEIRRQDSTILGLYKTFSIIEHSCIPNTTYVFNKNRQLTLKASVDIKQGEHLSTTYTHTLWGTLARRDHLKINKYFMCTCRRCADPTELGTHFSSLRCPNCPLGYLTSAAPLDELADWICSNCNNTVPVDKVKEITLELGEYIEKALISSSMEELEKIIHEKESTIVHPNHFHLFAAKHALLQQYGRTGDISDVIMKKKEKMCQEFLKICNILDPGMSRLAPYASTSLYELHLAILSRVRENPNGKGSVDSSVIKKDVETAKALLKQCIKILKDEDETQPEGQLAGIAKENLEELEKWDKTT